MALSVRMEPVERVKPHPSNPRRNHDVEGIARSIRAFGWRQPIVAWAGDGHVLAGHGRLLAAQHLGLDKVPVHWVGKDEITAAEAAAYRLADNRTAEKSEWDEAALLLEIDALDARGRELAGFDEAYLDELRARAEALDDPGGGERLPYLTDGEARQTLAERFGVPPFSVLNAREGWWQQRKAAWIALGIQSELGRGASLLSLSKARIVGGLAAINVKAEAASSFKNQGAQRALQEGKPHRKGKKPNATLGGAAMPAADYSKSKARGDGRGRAVKADG